MLENLENLRECHKKMDQNKENEVRKALDELFSSFSGCQLPSALSIAVSVVNNEAQSRFTYTRGHTELVDKTTSVSPFTYFDLASLTKPLVTALSIYILIERGKLTLNSTLGELLSTEKVSADKSSIQLDQLLSHCSGLAAHKNFYVQVLSIKPELRKQYVLDAILTSELDYKTGSAHIYSDLGYILLGIIVEKVSGYTIDRFFEENIAEPLGLADSLLYNFSINHLDINNCAATEVCPWTKSLLRGTVHDDNCRVMGGIAGHAGLFGTAEAVLKLCEYLVKAWRGESDIGLVSSGSLKNYIKKVGRSYWSCGFDTPTKLYSSSGKYFGENSIGHLGYTGTSFWIDLDKGISIVLLTNRVHPTRKNEYIRRLRPRIHNTIMEALVREG